MSTQSQKQQKGSSPSKAPITPPVPPRKSTLPPRKPVQKFPNAFPSAAGRKYVLTEADRLKRRKRYFLIAGLGTWSVITYSMYLYLQYERAWIINEHREVMYKYKKAERPDVDTQEVYEHISDEYDRGVRFSEWCLGMPLLRRYMMWGLKGDILEASAGTGRNNPYYPINGCKSVTLVDNSPKMLEIAKMDFENRYPKYGKIAFAAQDASHPITSPSGEGFDRVIQTMGLCSQKSPVETLQNLEKHCKPDGKILLLEHGRSHYGWLNSILDAFALDHAKTWGCWWNRDIGKLVKESGLVVDKITRYHFGTTWLIEASPRQSKPEEAHKPSQSG